MNTFIKAESSLTARHRHAQGTSAEMSWAIVVKMWALALAAGLLTVPSIVASAATIYDGAGPIDNSGNWNNGIPSTVGNPGTVNFAGDAGNGSLRNGTYFITQSAGTLYTSFGGIGLSAGNWVLDGGSVLAQNNDLTLSSSQTFTQNSGTVQAGADDFFVTSGASYVLNNGTLTVGDDASFTGGSITINGGTFTSDVFNSNVGSFTITGGTLNVNTLGNTSGSQDGGFTMNFNGGATTVTGSFGLFGDTTPNAVVFGGNQTGSLTAAGLVGTVNGTMDWLPGSLMAMTITGNTTWAETEWTADRMFFDGDSGSDLGLTWADVINPSVGFNSGGGTYFDWDGGTNTLALVTVPEPASLAAVGLFGLLGLGRLRRYRNRMSDTRRRAVSEGLQVEVVER